MCCLRQGLIGAAVVHQAAQHLGLVMKSWAVATAAEDGVEMHAIFPQKYAIHNYALTTMPA